MSASAIPSLPSFRKAVASLSDDELLRRLRDLVARSRRVEAEVVAHIAEVDARRVWAREATPSMFAYCTEVLHLSEAEAYLRIAVARASRQHPKLLGMLADGRLHLSGIAKLAPHLTPANRDGIFARAMHKSKRQIDELVAEMEPRPDALALIRKLPDPRASFRLAPGGPAIELRPGAAAPPSVVPLAFPQPTTPHARIDAIAPARYKVQFTANAQLRAKLDRLVALMRHQVPDGDLAAVLDTAISEKLARLEARRFAKTRGRKAMAAAGTSANGSRYIAASVRRAVNERDMERCRYVSAAGRRCSERVQLEYDHSRPHALGGDRSTTNIRLMCRSHNRYLAEQEFGRVKARQPPRSAHPALE